MEAVLTRMEIVRALNEWMRRYIEDPNKFAREFESVHQFLADQQLGVEPTYGETGADYLFRLNHLLREDHDDLVKETN